MRQKIQFVFLLVVLIASLLGQGCTSLPVFILWNNSSSDAKIEWFNGKTINLKSHSKHKLQNNDIEVAGRNFIAVIIWKGQRYGYVVDCESLWKFESDYLNKEFKSENLVARITSFQLEEDGKVYLLNPKGYKYGIMNNQPPGFPLVPVLISETK
jgi:hypothetical protein